MLNERSFTSEGLEISRASLSSLRRHPPPAGPVMRAAEGRWPEALDGRTLARRQDGCWERAADLSYLV